MSNPKMNHKVRIDVSVNPANAAAMVPPMGPGKATASIKMGEEVVGAFRSPELAAVFCRAPILRFALGELLEALGQASEPDGERALSAAARLERAIALAEEAVRSNDELLEKAVSLPPPSRIIRTNH